MILLLLAEEPTYGVALLERLEQRSDGAIVLNAGSLYRTIATLVDEDARIDRDAADTTIQTETEPILYAEADLDAIVFGESGITVEEAEASVSPVTSSTSWT